MQPTAPKPFLRVFDVAALKAAQGPPPPRLAAIAADLAPDPPPEGGAVRAAKADAMWDGLIAVARSHGPTSPLSVQQMQAGKAASRVEHRWEAEHGFARKATPQLEANYDRIAAGRFALPDFGSAKAAIEFATTVLSHIWAPIGQINRDGGGDPTIGAPIPDPAPPPPPRSDTPHHKALHDAQIALHARMVEMHPQTVDAVEAARMELFVENTILTRAFGLTSPVVERGQDGLVIRSFDILFDGRPVARSMGDGRVAAYGRDGASRPQG